MFSDDVKQIYFLKLLFDGNLSSWADSYLILDPEHLHYSLVHSVLVCPEAYLK